MFPALILPSSTGSGAGFSGSSHAGDAGVVSVEAAGSADDWSSPSASFFPLQAVKLNRITIISSIESILFT